MSNQDPRIDAYIAKAADFAKPILTHIRKLVHKACPGVTETVKWGMPFFEYNGTILCNIAAFKQHCAFGFWNASLMKDPEGIMQVKDRTAMGHFDRITSQKDLPSDKIMIAYIKESASLIEKGVKKPAPKKKAPAGPLPVPAELAATLKKNKKAQATFDAFSPSHRKEYIEWIIDAKTDATREKRLATTIEWLTAGKSRMWKYQK
ncbi:MAG TPA: YdeI/OmpD-associated family protein [Puia sp.]|nr:YdeI/OmpD-associated family protein [Puia sp.]